MEARGTRGNPCGDRLTVVLLYHDVVAPADRDSAGFPGPVAGRYKLDPELFGQHLDAVAVADVAVGLVDLDGPSVDAAFSFDDGGASALAVAGSLEARRWRGHFFVPTAWIGHSGFLTAAGVVELARRGHVVGSHSHTHPAYMARLSRRELEDEWRRSRDVLGDLLGEQPSMASVPGGSVSPTVVETAAEAGFRVLMTSDPVLRTRRFGPLTTMGRFGIWATTPSARAAAYASGRRLPRVRLWLEWNAKTLAKRVSPLVYERARRIRARRS